MELCRAFIVIFVMFSMTVRAVGYLKHNLIKAEKNRAKFALKHFGPFCPVLTYRLPLTPVRSDVARDMIFSIPPFLKKEIQLGLKGHKMSCYYFMFLL